MMHGQKNIKLP